MSVNKTKIETVTNISELNGINETVQYITRIFRCISKMNWYEIIVQEGVKVMKVSQKNQILQHIEHIQAKYRNNFELKM